MRRILFLLTIACAMLLTGCGAGEGPGSGYQVFDAGVTLREAERQQIEAEKAFYEKVAIENSCTHPNAEGEYAVWWFRDEDFRKVRESSSDADLIRQMDMEIAKQQELCPQAFDDSIPPPAPVAIPPACPQLEDSLPWEGSEDRHGAGQYARRYDDNTHVTLHLRDLWQYGGLKRFEVTVFERDHRGDFQKQPSPNWLRTESGSFTESDNVKDWLDDQWCEAQ